MDAKPMEPENLTLLVLREIRDEMRAGCEEQGRANERLASVEHAVGDLRGDVVDVKDRVGAVESRMGSIEGLLVDVGGHIRMMGRAMGVPRRAEAPGRATG